MRIRHTIQYSLVKQALQELGGHPSAQEIHERIQKHYNGISIATVYSNLKTMAQDGEVRVLSFAGRTDRYDYNLSPHDHILCQRCGRFCDIETTITRKIDALAAKTSGYIVKGHETQFFGICPVCQQLDT